jgi:Bcr/CflA subfamily drug resistance transporter
MADLKKLPPIYILLILLGFPQISETIYSPSLPDIARSLSVSINAAEHTLSIYFLGFALGVFTLGIMADVIGRRYSMLIGLSVYTVGSLGCSLAPSIEALLFCRFIQALGASAGSVVTQTMIRDSYEGAHRAKVFAIASGTLAFSPALGPALGGLIDQFFHWRANFYLLVVMGLVLLFTSWIKLPETQSHSERHWDLSLFKKTLKQMASDRVLIAYALIIGGCNGIIFSYYGEAPYLFIQIFQMSPFTYGLLGMIVALSSFVGALLSLRLIQIQSPVATLLTFLMNPVLPGQIPFFIWTLTLTSIFILFTGIGIIIPNALSQALSSYQDRIGTAGSIFGFFYYCIIAALTAGMGAFHNGSQAAMPLYFTAIAVGLIISGKYLLTHPLLKQRDIGP